MSAAPYGGMIDTIRQLFPKNRTIVSRDVADCLAYLATTQPLTLHRFPSGGDYQTWVVPPEWNVRKAVLTDGTRVIASYEESPLFLAPYSQSFSGWVSREELIAHTFTNPQQPEAFCYEFRLAYDFRRRLNEWRIALPHRRLEALPPGRYHVEIDVEVRPGEMLVAESAHPGRGGAWFTFLAHYCHVGQANDGLAGVAVMLEVMQRIRREFPLPQHGYNALLLPETIGSSVYAATHEERIDATLGAVFSEMAGADAPLQFVRSRRGDTYIDRVFQAALRRRGAVAARTVPFRKGWGNDELVFDSPGVGVPAVSLDRHPFEPYHTHFDTLGGVSEARLVEMADVLMDVVRLLERDYVPCPRNRVPPYLTRFDLYADWTKQRERYDVNALLLDGLWSGCSVLDLALKHGLEIDETFAYLDRFAANELIEKRPVTPEYARQMRFTPATA